MADINLIFGVLAVQLGFATPAQVMLAASAWVADKTQSLAERLEQSGALTSERRKTLEGLVEQAIHANGGDAAKTLATVDASGAVFRSFGGPLSGAPTNGASAVPLATPKEDDAVTSEQPGHYTIKSEYGRGGQSQVFLAIDEHIGREIALKQLLPDANTVASANATPVGRTRAAAIRFLREARITGRLEHPNIVPVYELGRRADGTHYYTQKLVRGETLRKKLAACKGLGDRLKLLGHFLDVCQAMAYAHSRNVIHRDLKPDNIMIGEFGETVVLDWGLAKLKGQHDVLALDGSKTEPPLEGHPSVTVEGHALGTPSYMSPEQALGKLDDVDERSDVWSLGAILYELLTGQPPFTGDTAFDVIGKVIKEPIPSVESLSPEAPRELIAISTTALHRDAARRYSNAAALAAEVEAYQSGGRVGAYDYTSWELLRRFATKNRAFSAVAAVSAVLLVAALFFIWREYTRAQSSLRGAVEARSIAEQQRNEAQAAHRLAEQALKRELLRNARRAAELVDRFCAETLRLPNPPMFNEPGPAPGHDAAEYLIPFSDYEPVDEDSPPHEGSRHLPRDLRDRVRGYGQDWLTKITDEDLNGLDFAWMQRLGEFDRWTAATVGFLHDLPPQLASAIPVPDYNGLQAWTKLRLADGLRKGDAAAASKELHHLADLIHSQGFILADLVASIILGMDHRARARAIELGQSVSGWPEFDPAQSGRYRRIMMSSFGYFLPEVSSEVAAKAIHCLPPGCAAVNEGLGQMRMWKAYGGEAGLDLLKTAATERHCEPALVARILSSPLAAGPELESAGVVTKDDGRARVEELIPDGGF